MDLRRQLSVIRHWAWLIVLAVVLAAGASYVISSSLPKVYEGKATLNVGQSLTAVDPDYQQLLASQRLSSTYATVATTSPVLAAVIERLGLPLTSDELGEMVSAQAPRDSTLITITAQHGDPTVAAAIANAVADELIAKSPAIQGQQSGISDFVDRELAATQSQIEELQIELEGLTGLPSRTDEQEARLQAIQTRLVALRQTYAQLVGFASGSAANLLTIIEPAAPATQPAAPRVLLNTLLAGLVGLLLALGLAFLIEHLDDTFKSPEHVTEAIDAPTLGAIDRLKIDRKAREHERLVTMTAPRSAAAEAYRTLRTNLEFASVDVPLRSILVTSAIPGEGKTTTASNIALAFAQAGRRVILLDADMRRPGIHKVFELPNSSGLTNLLRVEQPTAATVAHEVATNLRVITTGPLPPNPAELLASHRMEKLIGQLVTESELLVVDSPPLQAVTDAAVMAPKVTGTLLVIDAGRTRRGAVRQAKEALDRVGGRLLGVALNRLSKRARGGYYYYYDYYGASSTKQELPSSERGGLS